MDKEVSKKIADFFGQHELRSYQKGQVLILPDDDLEFVYHLVEGKVKIYDVNYRGDEIILNVFKPPAFFPMALAIHKTPNQYVYEADTDIAIRRAPFQDVVEFVRSNPDVMFDLLSRVYRGFDGLLGRMAQLMSGSAKSRLIYELLIEARRFGVSDNPNTSRLNITEKDLGSRTGLSRETVSREASKLRAEGVISLRGKTLTINDIAGLESRLGKTF